VSYFSYKKIEIKSVRKKRYLLPIMPRYNTRFQVKKQQQVQQQAQPQVQQQAQPQAQQQVQIKPNCICVLCSPVRYEKKPIPQEEIAYIDSVIRSTENMSDRQARVLSTAKLFEYIVAHPAIMSNPNFHSITIQKVYEFENDTTVRAYKSLLSSMENLKKL